MDAAAQICRVAVEKTAFAFDKLYSYAVPPALRTELSAGRRVLVPFRQATRFGICLDFADGLPGQPLKPVLSLADEACYLTEETAALVPWLKDNCFCTYYEAFTAMVPAALRRTAVERYRIADPDTLPQDDFFSEDARAVLLALRAHKGADFPQRAAILRKTGLKNAGTALDSLEQAGYVCKITEPFRHREASGTRMVSLARDDISGLTKKQKAALDLLRESGGAKLTELCEYAGVSEAVVRTLVVRGCAVFWNKEPDPAPPAQSDPPPLTLTPAQTAAYDTLRARLFTEKSTTALLFGVTGSGKTQVFLRLAQDVLDRGKSVLVLVPEIALTPQLQAVFFARWGTDAAVFHSGLSMAARAETFRRVRNHSCHVVLGTRSAVFAPLEEIGLIVLDEEHDASYKSQTAPRYHARDVARRRAATHKALLLLCSATPGVESYARAVQGQFLLVTLPSRFGGNALPAVRSVDMLRHSADAGGVLSTPLLQALQTVLDRGQQAMLLRNRRGYRTFLVCTACKEAVLCPRCSVSLTYHLAADHVKCHCCGYVAPPPQSCPVCGGQTIRYGGAGTQKIVELLQEYLPTARVARLDQDTAAVKHAREQILADFAGGNYDILVGTQMIAKGFNFHNVTLVGVTDMDQALYHDDYRALERAFALLVQVVGRAGRGTEPGMALVQTCNPNNALIRQAQAQDYRAFFETEIEIRKKMTYPPYCDICVLCAVSDNDNLAHLGCKRLLHLLKQRLAAPENAAVKTILLTPQPAKIKKLCNEYRHRLIVKCKNTAPLRTVIAQTLIDFGADTAHTAVTVYADMNPETML